MGKFASKTALIAFGGNLSDGDASPMDTLCAAAAMLPEAGFDAITVSRFYRTPCFPPGAGPDYVNAAAAARWPGSAAAALAALHAIEARFGRTRESRWGMRTLDLDLLALDAEVLPDAPTQTAWRTLSPQAQRSTTPDQLILPHPRLQDRGFVLVPLAEVAPLWRHPLTGMTVSDMRDALPAADLDGITPL